MKKIIGWILILLMILPVGFAQEGDSQLPSKKEEVVYGKIDMSGKIEEVYVVNGFLQNNGEIEDYGDYERITNLSTGDAISYKGDKITHTTEPGDFYYQGKMKSKEMPWIITFTYYLRGQKILPEDLLGQSGSLKIEVDVKKNPKINPVYFDNYVLQISMEMDSSKVHFVESEEATIATKGQNKVVNITHLPKKEGKYTITGVCNKCELGIIQVAGLPFDMMFELPDIDEYTKDLVLLQDAIAQLVSGVGEYTDGVGSIYDGSGQLRDGAWSLSYGINSLEEGFKSYQQGVGSFHLGLQDFSSGIKDFQSGMEQLVEGIDQFSGGISQLYEGTQQFVTGVQVYTDGVEQYTQGVSEVYEKTAPLEEGVNKLGEGLQELVAKGKGPGGLVEGSAQILQGMQTMEAAFSIPMTDQEIEFLVTLLQQTSGAFNQFMQNVDPLQWGEILDILKDCLNRFDVTMTQLESIANELMNSSGIAAALVVDPADESVQKLLAFMSQKGGEILVNIGEMRAIKAALSGMDPLIQAVVDNLYTLHDEFETLKGLMAKFNDLLQNTTPEDVAKLKDGLKIFSEQYSLFHNGLVQYVDGVEQVSNGVNGKGGLKDGVVQLRGGLQLLSEKGEELAEGGKTLHQGALGILEGVGKLLEGAEEFQGEGSQITSGVDKLAQGSTELVQGHEEILQGGDQLSKGVGDYADGMGSYAGGVDAFVSGLSQLKEGGEELSAGAYTFKRETSNLDSQMKEKIDDFMKEMLPGEYEIQSFTSEKNTNIQTVQFIMLSEGLSLPEEKVEKQEEEEEKSLLDKFFDLFQ